MGALMEDLQHIDHNVRVRASLELGKQCDVTSVSALIEALRHEQELFVREHITWALVRMRDASVMPLIGLLKDASPVARHAAAHALSKLGDQRAAEALLEALRDQDATVVSKAAVALGEIRATSAIAPLASLLGHELAEFRASLTAVLQKFGEPAVPVLIQALQHEKWRVREQAAETLGLLGCRQAVPALAEALGDEFWQVRFAAICALGDLGGCSAAEAVQTMHDDTNHLVRDLVPRMLERMKKRPRRSRVAP